MLGVISSKRDCCASFRVGSGRSSKCYTETSSESIYSIVLASHTLVVWRTLHRRGKSLTPASRVLIELSSICSEDCSEDTEEDSEEDIGGIWQDKQNKQNKQQVNLLLFIAGADRSKSGSGHQATNSPKRDWCVGPGKLQTSPLLSLLQHIPANINPRTIYHHVSPRKEVPRSPG